MATSPNNTIKDCRERYEDGCLQSDLAGVQSLERSRKEPDVGERISATGREQLRIEAEAGDDFSPHSLRSGFALVTAANGASNQAIKGHGGRKSERTTMRYIHRLE